MVNADAFMVWQLAERNNNDSGVLTFSVSRNHRASGLWDMLDWIATHAPGAYGVAFVHDDEDDAANDGSGRGGFDGSNEFRVHRILHGTITEMDDAYFGSIYPGLDRS